MAFVRALTPVVFTPLLILPFQSVSPQMLGPGGSPSSRCPCLPMPPPLKVPNCSHSVCFASPLLSDPKGTWVSDPPGPASFCQLVWVYPFMPTAFNISSLTVCLVPTPSVFPLNIRFRKFRAVSPSTYPFGLSFTRGRSLEARPPDASMFASTLSTPHPILF